MSAITDDEVPGTGRRALYALKRLPAAPLMLGATVEQIAALALRLQVFGSITGRIVTEVACRRDEAVELVGTGSHVSALPKLGATATRGLVN